MKLSRSKMSLRLFLAYSIPFFLVQAQMHECLNTFECPADKSCSNLAVQVVDGECGEKPCDYGPNRCVRKLGQFKECNIPAGDCRAGLYCAFDVPGRESLPVCIPTKKLGESCSPSDTRPCENDPEVQCNRITKRCEKFTGGRLNDKCEWSEDCRHEEGFFCSTDSKKCAPRKPDGAKCENRNYECLGFCVELKTPRGMKQMCISQTRLGEICQGDSSCAGYVEHRYDVDDVRCNNAQDQLGVCVRRNEILRKAGVVCDPKNDRCDRERDLYCRKAGNIHRCFQESSQGHDCTAGSKYSSCNEREAGAPLECRRPLSMTKKKPFGVAKCQQKPEIVRRGEICNRAEFARCERGTKCRAVAGIEAFDGDDPMPPLAYCVKLVKVGWKCRNRFKTGCVKGSYCIRAKCRKQKKAPRVATKYAGEYVKCRGKTFKKRCARGLTCPTSRYSNDSRCEPKSVKVLPGQPCYEHPNKRPVCTTGYACVQYLKGDGYRRCLKRGRLHDHCDARTCAKGLKCHPATRNSPFSEFTCYNPKTALPAGAKCTVSEKNRSHYCGVIEIDGTENSLKCTLVPRRRGNRKCKLENQLYEYCNEKDNIVCTSGLSCNGFNVCIKRN